MAAVIYNKHALPAGGFVADIDSDNVTNPHTTKPIVRIEVYLPIAADGISLRPNVISALAGGDIMNTTIQNCIDAAFT
jgi:hypothetical protein